MNTDSQNHLASMVHVHSGMAAEVLATLTEEAAEPLPAKVCRTLQGFAHDGQVVAQVLEERLDSMQEEFLALLHSEMHNSKLTTNERLHLFLSAEGQLVVEGSDTDAEKLCELINHQPALHSRFQDLARMALLAHGVEIVRQAHASLADGAAPSALLGRYHMCVKGPLSHFYVR